MPHVTAVSWHFSLRAANFLGIPEYVAGAGGGGVEFGAGGGTGQRMHEGSSSGWRNFGSSRGNQDMTLSKNKLPDPEG